MREQLAPAGTLRAIAWWTCSGKHHPPPARRSGRGAYIARRPTASSVGGWNGHQRARARSCRSLFLRVNYRSDQREQVRYGIHAELEAAGSARRTVLRVVEHRTGVRARGFSHCAERGAPALGPWTSLATGTGAAACGAGGRLPSSCCRWSVRERCRSSQAVPAFLSRMVSRLVMPRREPSYRTAAPPSNAEPGAAHGRRLVEQLVMSGQRAFSIEPLAVCRSKEQST